jgi:CRP/FNR family transcriptional regulator
MSSSAEVLARVPLLHDLRPAELTSAALRFREDSYAPETILFREGDTASRFWIVKAGQVKIVKYGEGGREIVVEVIPPGEAFGGATMLMPIQPATAQALSDLTTLSLSLDEYKALLRDYPAAAVRVIEMLGERMRGFIRMRAMAGERVERRVAHILLKLATKFGEQTDEGWMIRTSLTREDIAELSDTTVETAIRVMSRLNKEGLVKTLRGGYVVIRDRRRLQEISEGRSA